MLAKRRQTNTRRAALLLALAAAGIAAATAAASAQARPRGATPRAVEVLAPRFFPTWQARNVAFPFVMHDGARYRMYYAGSGASQLNDSAWDQWMTGLATSRDGRTWTFPEDYEPVLPAYRFKEGEVVGPARATQFDAMGAFGTSVLRDGGRWHMWYTGWDGGDLVDAAGLARPVGHRIGYATSADGVRWTRQAAAVLDVGQSGSFDSVSVGQPHVVRDGAGYRMYYEGDDGSRWRIAAGRSSDGRAWTREGIVIEPGTEGAPDARGARNPVVLQRGGRWEMWYQGLAADGGTHVLRAASEDGARWTKIAGEIILAHDPPLRAAESVHVDSVLPQPDGSLLVFFAREKTARRKTDWHEAETRSFHIYSQVVRP